jgi:hypothetical protein
MQKEKAQLKKVFAAMLVSMVWRLLFELPFGDYYLFVCYKLTR